MLVRLTGLPRRVETRPLTQRARRSPSRRQAPRVRSEAGGPVRWQPPMAGPERGRTRERRRGVRVRHASRRSRPSRVARPGVRGRAGTGQLAHSARTARTRVMVRRPPRRASRSRTPTVGLGSIGSLVRGGPPMHDRPRARTAVALTRGLLSRPAGQRPAPAPRGGCGLRADRRRRPGSTASARTAGRLLPARVGRTALSRDAAATRPHRLAARHRDGREPPGGKDRAHGAARLAGRRWSGPTTLAVKRAGN